ncbi:hypothetical protein GGC63_002097 [Paenibacillus sp. OAS669]|nr:hypothetical protein [Paenibacillus sp. OAS669]
MFLYMAIVGFLYYCYPLARLTGFLLDKRWILIVVYRVSAKGYRW